MLKTSDLETTQKNLRRIRYVTKNYRSLTTPTSYIAFLILPYTWKLSQPKNSNGLTQFLILYVALFFVLLLVFLNLAMLNQVGSIKFVRSSSNTNISPLTYLKATAIILFTVFLLFNPFGLELNLIWAVGLTLVVMRFWWKDPDKAFWWYQPFALVIVCLITATTLIFNLTAGRNATFSTFDYQIFVLFVGSVAYLVIDNSGDFILAHNVFRYKPRSDTYQESLFTEITVPEKVLKEVLTILSACESADLVILQRLTGIGEQTLKGMLTQLEDLELIKIKRDYHKANPTQLFMSITNKGREILQ